MAGCAVTCTSCFRRTLRPAASRLLSATVAWRRSAAGADIMRDVRRDVRRHGGRVTLKLTSCVTAGGAGKTPCKLPCATTMIDLCLLFPQIAGAVRIRVSGCRVVRLQSATRTDTSSKEHEG